MADSSSAASSTPETSTTKASSAADAPAGATPVLAEDHLKPSTKVAYAMGGTTDIFGHWLYNGLVDPVFNVFLGVSPTRVSIVRAVMLAVDAFSGLLFGWLSDNTRSRWGRRRPYILIGSILAGIGMPCLFLARSDWTPDEVYLYMLVSTILFSPIIACYNTPYQSLGSELTPDYNERTTVMAYRGVIQKTAGMLLNWGLWFASLPMWTDPATGKPDIAKGAMWAAAIAGGWMIVSGILNFVFVKERYYEKVQKQGRAGFGAMFGAAATSRPFLFLLGTGLVYAIPTGLVGTLGFYALNYYVFRNDIALTSQVQGVGGVVYMVAGFAGIFGTHWLSKRLGKKKALSTTLAIGLVGFGSSFWLYTPSAPWLSLVCMALHGFSATGLWVVLPSMNADIVDYDELSSGQRRESAYSAAFSWAIKVGMMFSMLIGGPLLELSGFDAALGENQTPDAILGIRLLFAGIPVIALITAIVLVHLYPLDAERMARIRAELEAKRGTV